MRWLRNILGGSDPVPSGPPVVAPPATEPVPDWRQRGNDALAAGDLAGAGRCYEQGVAAHPRDAALHLNLGFVLLQQGQASAAAERLREALALHRPEDGLAQDAHFLLGQAQRRLGRPEDALASFAAAVRAQPGFAEPMADALQVCRETGRRDEALGWATQLVQARPTTENRQWHALQLADCGRHAEAADVLAEALAQDAGATQARMQRFGVLFGLRRFEEARAEARAVVDAQGGRDPAALVNLSAALEKLDRLEEALDHVDRALALDPGRRDGMFNRVAILHGLGRHREAVTAARQALARWPDDADLHNNLALMLLLLGEFEDGWAEHEWRMRSDRFSAFRVPEALPLWRGESLAGKTIFLYGEQGFGDSLQFVRYVPQVCAQAGEVVLQVPNGLEPLVDDLAANCRLLPQNVPLPAIDFHCPLMSLPYVLGTREDSIPAPVPYLRADTGEVRAWRETLGSDGFNVGIAWSGNPTHVNDRNRSMPLAMFRQIATPGCRFFTLQPDIREEDRPVLQAWDQARDAGREMRDFAETAAFVEALDLVITVDTSVAHLAGALGKPVWVLLPFVPDWRWLLDRPTSPWYPTARLYRQPVAKDWDTVLAQVRADLAALVADRSGAPRAA